MHLSSYTVKNWRFLHISTCQSCRERYISRNLFFSNVAKDKRFFLVVDKRNCIRSTLLLPLLTFPMVRPMHAVQRYIVYKSLQQKYARDYLWNMRYTLCMKLGLRRNFGFSLMYKAFIMRDSSFFKLLRKWSNDVYE